MIRHTIVRLMFYVLLIGQMPCEVFAVQPDQSTKKPSLQVASQSATASTHNEPRLASSESKKAEENSGWWSNPLVKIGAVVVVLYGGGAIIAGAIYSRIKDLIPNDGTRKKHDDDEYK